MPKFTYVVLTNAVEGREAEFNDWYDTTHLQDALKVPGFAAAQRFRLATGAPAQQFVHRYLTIYDVETDDLDETRLRLREIAGTEAMVISDALDRAGVAAG